MSELPEKEKIRAMALTEASLIASQVALLVKEFRDESFRHGVEMACEEIIERLLEAGAYRPKPTDDPGKVA